MSTAKNVYAAGITVPGTVPLTLPGLVPAARPQPRRPISAQPQLPFPRYRPALVQHREIRSAFHPPAARSGGYTLPKAAQDRLTTSLRGFRNREAAFALAVFLARYWSAPGRIELAFTVDRRALDEHGELGLSEARVRGALRTLDRVGYVDRELVKGSPYKPRGRMDEWRRKPILFVFGPDFREIFRKANAGAARPRIAARRVPPEQIRRPVAATSSPITSEAESSVHLGELRNWPAAAPPSFARRRAAFGGAAEGSGVDVVPYRPKPAPTASDPKLEAAIARFLDGRSRP